MERFKIICSCGNENVSLGTVTRQGETLTLLKCSDCGKREEY